MRRMIRTTVAAATVLAAALAGGTAGPAPAAVAAPGGELRVFTLEPGSLLPAGATDPAAGLLARQLYRGLVSYQPDGTPVLELAESIESSDQQLWTVQIRPGYAFHDGVPVDAAAFVRGWEHARTGPYAPLFDQIVDVVAEDSQTLTIELAEPAVSFPARLGHPAFSPLAQACLDNLAACAQEPIGNGPYRIVGSWQPGVGAVLERFEDYPDLGQAQPDTLRFQVYPSVAAGCDAFQQGALDVLHPVTAPCRPDPALALWAPAGAGHGTWPVLDAYLAPQFATGGPANHTGYRNPEVDALLADGGATADLPDAVLAFQEGEDRILADLPVIPTWLSLWEAAYSPSVDQLAWNLFTGPDYGRTTLH